MMTTDVSVSFVRSDLNQFSIFSNQFLQSWHHFQESNNDSNIIFLGRGQETSDRNKNENEIVVFID